MIQYHYQDHLGEPLNFGNIAAMYFVGLRGGVHVMVSDWLKDHEHKIITCLMEQHHNESPGAIVGITRDELEVAKEKALTA